MRQWHVAQLALRGVAGALCVVVLVVVSLQATGPFATRLSRPRDLTVGPAVASLGVAAADFVLVYLPRGRLAPLRCAERGVLRPAVRAVVDFLLGLAWVMVWVIAVQWAMGEAYYSVTRDYSDVFADLDLLQRAVINAEVERTVKMTWAVVGMSAALSVVHMVVWGRALEEVHCFEMGMGVHSARRRRLLPRPPLLTRFRPADTTFWRWHSAQLVLRIIDMVAALFVIVVAVVLQLGPAQDQSIISTMVGPMSLSAVVDLVDIGLAYLPQGRLQWLRDEFRGVLRPGIRAGLGLVQYGAWVVVGVFSGAGLFITNRAIMWALMVTSIVVSIMNFVAWIRGCVDACCLGRVRVAARGSDGELEDI